MRPAVKVARIAGASRHSRLENEPIELTARSEVSELWKCMQGQVRLPPAGSSVTLRPR